MKKIDFKSIIIGLLLGVCVVIGLGAQSSVSNIGRYRISTADSSGQSCFVIDSATGRMWKKSMHELQFAYIGKPEDWGKKKVQPK